MFLYFEEYQSGTDSLKSILALWSLRLWNTDKLEYFSILKLQCWEIMDDVRVKSKTMGDHEKFSIFKSGGNINLSKERQII